MESIIILKRYVLAYFVFSAFFLNAQSSPDESFIRNYQLSSEQYISGIDGKVYMNVHIWGAGGTSGTIRVHEGIDFASLMSAAGGPSQFANLKKIRLYREKPDQNGQLVYFIDLTDFLDSGDRSNFPKIKPNDTIIIKKTLTGVLVEEINTIQTLLTAFTFFITISNTFNLL